MRKKQLITVFLLFLILVPIFPDTEKNEAPDFPDKAVVISLNLAGPLFFGIYEGLIEVAFLKRLSAYINPTYYNSDLCAVWLIFFPQSARQLWSAGGKLGMNFYFRKSSPIGGFSGVYINTAYFTANYSVWDSINSGFTIGPGFLVGYRSLLANIITLALKTEMQYMFPMGLSILRYAPVRADQPGIVGLNLYLGMEFGIAF